MNEIIGHSTSSKLAIKRVAASLASVAALSSCANNSNGEAIAPTAPAPQTTEAKPAPTTAPIKSECSVDQDTTTGNYTIDFSSPALPEGTSDTATIRLKSNSEIYTGQMTDEGPGDWEGSGVDTTANNLGMYVVEFVNHDLGDAQTDGQILGTSMSAVSCKVIR